MRRMLKKSIAVLLTVVLLLSTLSACEQNQKGQPFTQPICQHTFETTQSKEFRYYSASLHGCYEIEIKICTKCGFTQKDDVGLLYRNLHSLGVVEGVTVTDDDKFIFHGLCEYCGARVRVWS